MYGISLPTSRGLPLTEGRGWLTRRLAMWREALEQHRQVSVPLLVALSFLAGVGGAAQGNVVAGALVLSGIVGLVLAVWLGRQPWWFMGGLCLLASACGALRWLHHTPPPAPADLAFHVEDARTVRGIVTAAPIQRQRSQQVTVGATEVETARGRQPVDGRVMVWARPYPAVQVGDNVTLVGAPQRPAAALPAGYAAYLQRNGVQAVMSFPRVYVRRPETPRGWQARMSRLRVHLRRVIDTHLPEPHAALAAGILLGQRADIPRSLNEQMHLTGTSHIIAISGANLTIIAGLLSLVIRRSGRALAGLAGRLGGSPALPLTWQATVIALLALSAIWAYAWLVGWGASVVRAAVMSSLVLAAPTVQHRSFAPTSLTWAAVAMVAIRPTTLWDVGFQLSVLATAGILFLAPALQARLGRLPGWLGEPLALTLAAQIAVLPVLMVTFGRVSLISPVPNVVLAPLFAPIMVCGLALLALGGLAPLLGHVLTVATDLLGWILWAHLTVLIETARLFSAVPGAALTLPPLPPIVALPAYLGLAGLAWRLRRRPGAAPLSTMGNGGWALLALVGCLVAGVVGWNLIATRPPAAAELWLPSVADGRLALLRLPTGATVLIDGGATHTAAVQLLGRALPFWQRRVDVVITTDPRAGTLTGLLPVLERYQVGRVLDAGGRYPSARYRRYEQVIGERRFQRRTVRPGDRIRLTDDIALEITAAAPLPVAGRRRTTGSPAAALSLAIHTPAGMLRLPGGALRPGDTSTHASQRTDTAVMVRPLGAGAADSAVLTVVQGQRLGLLHAGRPAISVGGGVRLLIGPRGVAVQPFTTG